MIVCQTIRHLRQEIAKARLERSSTVVGFVPTMGALHAGHVSLIDAAREKCDLVVVSIFVNPTQFGSDEDFEKYPRPIGKDTEKCRAAGVGLVFHPSVEEMCCGQSLTSVRVAEITENLCGKHRPGHFDGVALVVTKLLNIVQPDRAYFGQKDAQQLAMIRSLARDLNLPIEIVPCPIVREPDGLAVSSRNAYLDPAQRQQATILYRSLLGVRDAIRAGARDAAGILGEARELIEQAGPCEIDYVELADPESMKPVSRVQATVLAALAVRIGPCRLIDNLLIDVGTGNRVQGTGKRELTTEH